MFKKRTLLSLLAVSSLALAACGMDEDGIEVDPTPPVEELEETTDDATNEETQDPADDYANLTIKPEEAYDIYLDEYPDAQVTQVQLDQDMGSFVYKVEGFEGTTEYEIKINPIDGSITDVNTDMDSDMDEMEITRDHVVKVMDLVDMALADAEEGAELKEWTLDEDDGIMKLEVELDTGGLGDQERTYNVDTGELIEIDD